MKESTMTYQYLAIRLVAPFSSNGNGRRLWLIINVTSGAIVRVVNEGAKGSACLNDLPADWKFRIALEEVKIGGGEYSRLRKEHKAIYQPS